MTTFLAAAVVLSIAAMAWTFLASRGLEEAAGRLEERLNAHLEAAEAARPQEEKP